MYAFCVFVQLFGYSNSANADETDAAVKSYDVNSAAAAAVPAGETAINVFALSAKRRVGDAAGSKHHRDIVVQIRRVDELDCYLTATRRGVISTWSNKVIN